MFLGEGMVSLEALLGSEDGEILFKPDVTSNPSFEASTFSLSH